MIRLFSLVLVLLYIIFAFMIDESIKFYVIFIEIRRCVFLDVKLKVIFAAK